MSKIWEWFRAPIYHSIHPCLTLICCGSVVGSLSWIPIRLARLARTGSVANAILSLKQQIQLNGRKEQKLAAKYFVRYTEIYQIYYSMVWNYRCLPILFISKYRFPLEIEHILQSILYTRNLWKYIPYICSYRTIHVMGIWIYMWCSRRRPSHPFINILTLSQCHREN